MDCCIIAVVMGIILSIMGNFLSTTPSIIGKILSIIGQGLKMGKVLQFHFDEVKHKKA